MDISSNAPIGIFDSGIGGLTVARAVKDLMPAESIIYFGDTAHLPYGDKSTAAIQAYSVKVTDVLIKEGCKCILIACNSASSAAYDLLKEYSGSKAYIINVIDPIVEYISKKYKDSEIGIIGTKQTIHSNIYEKKLLEKGDGLKVRSVPTPLLVPMIEEGFIHGKISHDIISEYLEHKEFESIEALILGCTHYPLIKEEITELMDKNIGVYDSAIQTAEYLKFFLESKNLTTKDTGEQNDRFLVSDFTVSFEKSAKLFFGRELHLEKFPLWE